VSSRQRSMVSQFLESSRPGPLSFDSDGSSMLLRGLPYFNTPPLRASEMLGFTLL
jgi:hypothetical protein